MRQMKRYLPDKQQERAQDLGSALNSRDRRKLQLLRNTSAVTSVLFVRRVNTYFERHTAATWPEL